MKAGVLFSGGKDSSLAAVLLSRDYRVELNTFVFHAGRRLPAVEKAAKALGFPWHVMTFEEGLLERAVEMIRSSGYPNDAIQMVHRCALLELSRNYDIIADGTRFDDRVPMLTRDEVQSFQDSRHCSYIRPLLGFPRREVDSLASRHLRIVCGETSSLENGDYEAEIRDEFRARGEECGKYFPAFHEQSLVIGTTSLLG